MPRRNLTLLLITIFVSFACYAKAARNRYASIIAEAMMVISDDALEITDPRDLFEDALRGMVRANLDEHSQYFSPEELQPLQESLDQEFCGVGIELDTREEKLTVLMPVVDGPAHRAGIRPGDVILAIDGELTASMANQVAQSRIRGKCGSSIRLRVRHRDDSEQEFTITRDRINVESVKGDTRDEQGHWKFVLATNPRIGYIRVVSFGEHTAQELAQALEQIQGQVDGLIIDLRYNVGGLLTTAVESCDLFLDQGVIVTTRGRDEVVRSRYDATPDLAFPLQPPMAVLINNESASASEIMAACLQDHGRAAVVGERSFGKGTVQNIYLIEGGRSALKLTVASYWRPSGKNIHRLEDAPENADWGVRPNPGLEVKLANDEQRMELFMRRRDRDVLGADQPSAPEFSDPQLDRGVDYLLGRIGTSR